MVSKVFNVTPDSGDRKTQRPCMDPLIDKPYTHRQRIPTAIIIIIYKYSNL